MIRQMRHWLAAAALMAGAGAADPAPAQDALRVVLPDLQPLAWRGPDGTTVGLSYDLSRAIVDGAGLPATFVIEPFARTIQSVLNESADALITFPNEQLRPAVAVAPVRSLNVIVLPAPGQRVTALDDLRGRSIGQLRASSNHPALERIPEIRIEQLSSYDSGFRMLQLGRLDGLIGADVTLYHALRGAGLRPQQFGPPFVVEERIGWLYLRAGLRDTETAARLKTVVDRLRESGTFEQIAQPYLR